MVTLQQKIRSIQQRTSFPQSADTFLASKIHFRCLTEHGEYASAKPSILLNFSLYPTCKVSLHTVRYPNRVTVTDRSHYLPPHNLTWSQLSLTTTNILFMTTGRCLSATHLLCLIPKLVRLPYSLMTWVSHHSALTCSPSWTGPFIFSTLSRTIHW